MLTLLTLAFTLTTLNCSVPEPLVLFDEGFHHARLFTEVSKIREKENLPLLLAIDTKSRKLAFSINDTYVDFNCAIERSKQVLSKDGTPLLERACRLDRAQLLHIAKGCGFKEAKEKIGITLIITIIVGMFILFFFRVKSNKQKDDISDSDSDDSSDSSDSD